MKKKAVLGIDPGEKGSICCLNYPHISLHDYKDTLTAFADLGQLGSLFDINFVVIEKIWFRGGDAEKNVKATERLIRNQEMWITLLKIYKIRYIEVAPSTWRKGLVRNKGGKNEAMATAKSIFHESKGLITRHDEAEAALMAYRAYQHVRAGRPTEL